MEAITAPPTSRQSVRRLLAYRAAKLLEATGGCPLQAMWALQPVLAAAAGTQVTEECMESLFALREAAYGRFDALLSCARRESPTPIAAEVLTMAVVLGAFCPQPRRQAFWEAVEVLSRTGFGRSLLGGAHWALGLAGLALRRSAAAPQLRRQAS